nr:oligopeptide transporter, OPT family [uncultured Holophaga sp.]
MTQENPSGPLHGLPENARRPLASGETYVPLVPQDGVPEVTVRSVTLGLVFCAIFSMAAAYLALKLGQGIEAAIPISILAVGLSRFFSRRNSILENVIAQSIGANSSHVVSGAVFTLPALYMLSAMPGSGVNQPTLWQVVLVSFIGGCLGILFLIPLRHHFMVENHGVFPWPEATATAEILVTGERAGNQARELAVAAVVGAAYDGLVTLFRAMGEEIRFRHAWIGDAMEKRFLSFNMLNSAATLGIGYIIGLRYSAIIAAGSFFSMFVLVPLVHAVGQYTTGVVPPGTVPIAGMSPEQVFFSYVRIIGVGAIAGAGVMGVLASLPNMVRSIISNLQALLKGDKGERRNPTRVERSMTGAMVAVGLVACVLMTFLFLSFGLGIRHAVIPALMGTVLVMVISFLFAPVAARAIATIGTNPISGMTMLTLVITGVVMLKLGFSGGYGMFLTLMVGGIVCTALAASGAFSTDLKIGHWIGATPARQIGWKFVGTFVAALFCGIAMWKMAQLRTPDGLMAMGTNALPAPQASAMRAILEGIFGSVSMPLRWYCFGLGIVFSVILRILGVPALGFALGMYLPIEVNTPLLLGGILSHFVNKAKAGVSEEDRKAKENRGVLIASGLMAGGAIMGVVASFVKASVRFREGFPILSAQAASGATGEWVAIIAMALLCGYVVIYSRKAKA